MRALASPAPSAAAYKPVTAQRTLAQPPLGLQSNKRRCICREYHEPIPYQQAWLWQKDLVAEGCSGHEPAEDTLLLLQHPPVYTLGAGSTTDHLRFDPASPPHPLYRTERGGEVTYHGPGQLVLYPIMNLKMHMQDLHWYLQSLEEVVIRALENVSGLKGERIKGCTGVWVNNEKIAAVGVRAQKWVTYHGVAMNVTTDLQPFQHIVPCGISSRGVTSVKQLAVHEGASDEELIHEYQFGLLDAFAEVFNVELVQSKPL
ncbi:hypothetical protein WJX82_005717 [Trebouxia sp. C0006]